MDPRNIALVNCTTLIKSKEVSRVANAIARQVANEFADEWQITGAVIAIDQDEPLPPGFSAINLYDRLDEPGLNGIHYYSELGEAYANVSTSIPHWSLAASHEALELITDPTTERTRHAPHMNNSSQMVDYLLEVCDPCQHYNYSYSHADSGVVLSDFYLRSYFDPSGPTPGIYSYNEKITRPLQILPGGYLCWRDASGQWYRATADDSGTKTPQRITHFSKLPGDSLRERLDFDSSNVTTAGYFCDTGEAGRKLTEKRDAELKKERAGLARLVMYRKRARELHYREIKTRLKTHKRVSRQ